MRLLEKSCSIGGLVTYCKLIVFLFFSTNRDRIVVNIIFYQNNASSFVSYFHIFSLIYVYFQSEKIIFESRKKITLAVLCLKQL